MRPLTVVRTSILTALCVGVALWAIGFLEARQLRNALWFAPENSPRRPATVVLAQGGQTESPPPVLTQMTIGMRPPEQVIHEAGCAACHAFTGPERSVGPSLWDIGARAGEEYIRQSILAPNAMIADGYPANVMPQDLAEYMTAAEFERLVQWLRDHKGPTVR
jgi:mono/diheme cytochrome c family protein